MAGFETIDDYVRQAAQPARDGLQAIRAVVREVAPEAEEAISYRMPAFRLKGKVLIYFAAFKAHLGVYPPVRDAPELERALAPYAGPKGNLKFPLAAPLPLDLIRTVVEHRVRAICAGA